MLSGGAAIYASQIEASSPANLAVLAILETGSIATACLARSSGPLETATHSCDCGDLLETRKRGRMGGLFCPGSVSGCLRDGGTPVCAALSPARKFRQGLTRLA